MKLGKLYQEGYRVPKNEVEAVAGSIKAAIIWPGFSAVSARPSLKERRAQTGPHMVS